MKVRTVGSVVGGCLALMLTPAANAALLGLSPSSPDLTLFSGSLSYVFDAQCLGSDGSTLGACGTDNGQNGPNKVTFDGPLDEASSSGLLSIIGSTMVLGPDGSGTLIPVSGGSYDLMASFTGAGLFDSGSVTALGTTSDPNFQSGTLVAATITDLGFGGSDSSGVFDMSLSITGGDMASFSADGGVIASTTTMSPVWVGDWDASLNDNPAFWQRSFGATVSADTFANASVVPVPAAVWLLGSGLVGLIGVARRGR